MPSLSVRKLDSDTLARLRMRAARHGVSMEEEARRIIRAAVQSQVKIGDLAREYFGEENGVDLQLPKHSPHEPMNLSE